jgi:hypothetical protein
MSKDIDELEQRIEQIKHKLIERDIQLNPCLGEHDVESFEAQYNIRLPDAYRRFLLEVGNGGTGPPSYGLEPLAETLTGSFPPDDWTRFRPDLPFPLTDGWNYYVDDEQLSDEIEAATVEHGHLYLGTRGCGEDWILITTGNERGYVWMRTEMATVPCEPRRDFLSWYEYWLDSGSLDLDIDYWSS